MSNTPTIIIIGAGIIGLTTAIKLQEKLSDLPKASRPQILIVAREWPSSIPGAPPQHSVDYASMWAGAHVRPIPATTPQLRQEAKWLRTTVAEFARQVSEDPACGVTPTVGVEYLEAPERGYLEQDAESFARETGLSGYKRAGDVPAGVALGYEYDTFCINSPVYCAVLLRRFVLAGGRTMWRDLRSEWEAHSLVGGAEVVINASGCGFGDILSFPTRGQTVVTDLVVDKTVTRQHRDGTWSFLIPRFFHGGTIVGGTKEPGDWEAVPRAQTRLELLRRGVELVNVGLAGVGAKGKTVDEVVVVADIVGRRPTRQGGMRIEVERREAKAVVVHAYGAGGRGYEISWGVANDVVDLVVPLLKTKIAARL